MGSWVSPAAPHFGLEADQLEITKTIYHSLVATTARTANYLIFTPSKRLSCIIEVLFEPDDGVQGTYTWASTNHKWVLDAMALPVAKLAATPLNNLQTSDIVAGTHMLPTAYELDSGLRAARASLTMISPHINGVESTGIWAIRARWEPNTPMSKEQVKAFFAKCSIIGNLT